MLPAFPLRRALTLLPLLAGLGGRVWAQQAAPAAPDGQVQLSFPDQTELTLLVDYVSQRLHVKILYDEQVANKKLTIKAPDKIPAESLLADL